MQLTEAIDLFKNRPEIASDTKRSYHYDLKQFANYTGDKLINEISPVDVLRYFQHQNSRDISDHTYNKHLKSIRALFNWAVGMDLIEKNPARAVGWKKTSSRVPESKAMPKKDLDTLINFVSSKGRGYKPRDEALVRFLADTGARIGSCSRLRERDLNLKERTARIYQKGKTEKLKVIYSAECAEAITLHLLQRDATEGDYIFSEDGKRLKSRSLSQRLRRIGEDAGVAQPNGVTWGPHSIRHKKGHDAAKHPNIPLSIAAEVLGDTIEVFLKHYAPHDEESIIKAMETLISEALSNTTGTRRIIKIHDKLVNE